MYLLLVPGFSSLMMHCNLNKSLIAIADIVSLDGISSTSMVVLGGSGKDYSFCYFCCVINLRF